VEHQRGHWKVHKVECKAFAASGAGGAAGGAGAAGRAGAAAPEGKDAGEGGGGGDAGERTATEARYDTLGAKMKEDGFDIMTTPCGPKGRRALWFALGEKGEPYDEKAVKLALGVPGVDVNVKNVRGQSMLSQQCFLGRSRNAKLLVADPRVDPNLPDERGATPLYVAASEDRDRCVEVLLSDPRVDPNIADTATGYTPLNIAAQEGMDRCVELLLGDNRVDVARASANGMTPLVSACVQIMNSMDQVGVGWGKDPARTLVIMLRSRRIPKHNLKEGIASLFPCMPNKRQIHNAEVGGEPLRPNQKMARLVLPVLLVNGRS
jgi:hypothetical protein